MSEVNLTSAVVIGAALALVLSLSIIPAQKAAEAFSPAILRLYAGDRSLLLVFLILVLTTMGSILLGTRWIGVLNAKASISIQFVLLESPSTLYANSTLVRLICSLQRRR